MRSSRGPGALQVASFCFARVGTPMIAMYDELPPEAAAPAQQAAAPPADASAKGSAKTKGKAKAKTKAKAKAEGQDDNLADTGDGAASLLSGAVQTRIKRGKKSAEARQLLKTYRKVKKAIRKADATEVKLNAKKSKLLDTSLKLVEKAKLLGMDLTDP